MPNDRNESDANEMTADEWADFYNNCERRTEMSLDEYLDHDCSMNG